MKLLLTCTIAAFALSLVDTADARFRYSRVGSGPKAVKSSIVKGPSQIRPTSAGGAPEPSSALGLIGAAGFLALRRRRK